ncbi:MAG: lipopolysaccharide heptosyltransferase II [Bryobacteraceae bacterium]
MAWSNILVRATNWVGDAVLSLPALRAIRERNPQAHLAILARPWVAGLYAREPFCDEHIAAPRSIAARLGLARALRQRRFDAAILLPNSFEAALIARLAGIPQRIGYRRDGRGFLLTAAIPPPRPSEIPRHESFYYLELLRRAGILPELPPAAPILLYGSEEARRIGQERFQALGFPLPVIGISPGAENSRAKQWLPERFVEAATLLAASLQAGVVLFGSPKEQALCRLLAAQIRKNGCRVLNLAGETTLAQFVELAAACRLFLANDSGAMHVASALGVPTLAVFGPTDWIATAPAGPHFRILRQPVDCSPCQFRDCPIDHRCMTGVTAQQVAQAALELVK